jgi:hypothetical protein
MLHVVDRRDVFQQLTVLLEIAILRDAEVATLGTGVREEGEEVGDADDIDPDRPSDCLLIPINMKTPACQRLGASEQSRMRWLGLWLRFQHNG